jgi:hypothetical protein
MEGTIGATSGTEGAFVGAGSQSCIGSWVQGVWWQGVGGPTRATTAARPAANVAVAET